MKEEGKEEIKDKERILRVGDLLCRKRFCGKMNGLRRPVGRIVRYLRCLV
jgi:hypothetical protein